MEADVLAYQNIKIERKQNGGMYLDDMLDSDTADIIREQLKQKIGEQGYGADFLANNTTPVSPIRDKNIDELGNHNNVESDTKTDKKDDLESISTDELASLLRGEMNDLDISLKQDMPELNKSLDINNYRPKE